jgi:hypothetical protein
LVGFSNFVIQRRSTATAEEEEEEEGEEEEEADLASYPRALRANFHFWVHCFVAMGATAKTPLLQAQDHSAHVSFRSCFLLHPVRMCMIVCVCVLFVS